MGQGAGPVDHGDLRWAASGEWELAARQLRAIAAFHHARAIAAWAAAASQRSRAMREQDARMLEVLRRKHQAVIDRAHEQLRSSGVRRPAPERLRVVVADRGADDELVRGLEGHGIRVLARVANGADAVGITLVEQPDVVVVSEALDMVPADDVVRDVRRYSPGTRILVLAGTDDEACACAGAGATVVRPGELATGALARRILDIAEQHPG